MLIALLITLSITIGIVLYMLLAPVVLEIDTELGLYRLRLHWLAWGRLYFVGYEPWMEVKVGWWRKQYNLLQMLKKVVKTKEEYKPKPKKKKKPGRLEWGTVKRVVQSFKVEKFCWQMDTGDYALNGQLYPIFWWYKLKSGHNTEINFTGNNYLALTIKNSGWRVLKAMIINK